MDVTYRIESEEPESVAETEVIRYWLRKEIEEDTEDNLDPDTLDDRKELLDALVDRKPLAESIFGEADRNWYRLVLSEHELRGLEVVHASVGEGLHGRDAHHSREVALSSGFGSAAPLHQPTPAERRAVVLARIFERARLRESNG